LGKKRREVNSFCTIPTMYQSLNDITGHSDKNKSQLLLAIKKSVYIYIYIYKVVKFYFGRFEFNLGLIYVGFSEKFD